MKRLKKALARGREINREKGILHTIRIGAKVSIHHLNSIFWYYSVYKPFRSSQKFKFQGKDYFCFYHLYNTAWRNERVVEIPIVWEIIKKYHGKKILEVGNVLSHYFPITHDVLDKYEKADGIINEDVVDFQTAQKYDLIVSISTLEHVGWNEKPRDPMKIIRSIENLKSLLALNGKIIITMPVGFNPILDKQIDSGEITFTKMYSLKRLSRMNTWEETDWQNIKNSKYGSPFISANALVVGIIEKK